MNYNHLYICVSDNYPGNHEIATAPGEYAQPIIRAIQHPISVKNILEADSLKKDIATSM